MLCQSNRMHDACVETYSGIARFSLRQHGILCCMGMYRLATKYIEKKRIEKNAKVSFLRETIRRALVVLHSVIH